MCYTFIVPAERGIVTRIVKQDWVRPVGQIFGLEHKLNRCANQQGLRSRRNETRNAHVLPSLRILKSGVRKYKSTSDEEGLLLFVVADRRGPEAAAEESCRSSRESTLRETGKLRRA